MGTGVVRPVTADDPLLHVRPSEGFVDPGVHTIVRPLAQPRSVAPGAEPEVTRTE